MLKDFMIKRSQAVLLVNIVLDIHPPSPLPNAFIEHSSDHVVLRSVRLIIFLPQNLINIPLTSHKTQRDTLYSVFQNEVWS